MGHFSKDTTARRGDAFDGAERAVWVERVLHAWVAVEVTILSGDLAVGGKLSDDFRWGVEFAFAVGNRDGVDCSNLLIGEPRR